MPPPFPMPPTFILQARFVTSEEQKELHRLEEEIGVTFKPAEAKLVLGKVKGPGKAKGLLAMEGLQTEILRVQESEDGPPERKRRRIDEEKEKIVIDDSDDDDDDDGEGSETMSENETAGSRSKKRGKRNSTSIGESSAGSIRKSSTLEGNTIKVLELNWYYDSVTAGNPLPEDKYFVYEGRIISFQKPTTQAKKPKQSSQNTILARARAATPPPSTTSYRKYGHQHQRSPPSQKKPPNLTQEDTEDHEASQHMPALPEDLTKRYSCERATPMHSPNDAFIEQLKIIRHARDLEDNKRVGHDFSAKSYSAAIAALKAYPHEVASEKELRRLPGCGDKVTNVWVEWHRTGSVREVKEIQNDERLNTLNEFYGIHGVADKTARAFYDEKGWRDLDDIIEHGWQTLNRDQQIGLKHYHSLSLRIPRAEVAATQSIILAAANSLHAGFQICAVGGYRRGKIDSGDMDFILSHPDESVTQNFIGHLLDILRDEQWVVHELTVSYRGSGRRQETLAWRGADGKRKEGGGRKVGSGFDTLDHAFVVWQNPGAKSKTKTKTTGDDDDNDDVEGHGDDDEDENEQVKENDNPYRRVDIIITPWKTAGCAILGWTGGTLFERDLRSYCRNVKGWKFDSSGIRRVSDGEWIDLEGREGDLMGEHGMMMMGEDGNMKIVTLEEKERRVFEGLGLVYREPWERCTH